MSQSKANTQMNFTEVEVLDSHPLRGIFADYKDVRDINPKSYPVLFNKTQSVTENALSILEQHFYNPKIFCKAEMQDRNSEFNVKSNKWEWRVKPMSIEHAYQTPPQFMKAIGILIENDIQIDGIANAFPEPREIRTEVIKQEFIREVKALSQIAETTFLLISSIITKTNKSTNMSNIAQPVNLGPIPDPVLLVMVENNWIEIGRW